MDVRHEKERSGLGPTTNSRVYKLTDNVFGSAVITAKEDNKLNALSQRQH